MGRTSLLVVLVASMSCVSAADVPGGAGEAKKGAFQLTFDAHGPHSTIAALGARMKLTDKSLKDFDLEKETFEAFVPADYDGGRPYGLVVFVNSADKGQCPKQYQEVLARHRMIWIGANNSGNERKPPTARLGMALDAVHHMKQRYKIDTARVYVSGISGGGAMAALVMCYFPDVFTGGFPMCAPGAFYGTGNAQVMVDFFVAFSKPKPEQMKLLQENSRFAVCTGEKDFNLSGNKRSVEWMKQEKLHAELFEVPGMGHTIIPGGTLDKVLAALDAPLKERAKPRYDKALADERARKFDDAIEGYAYAVANGDGAFVADAKTKLEALEASYAKAVKEIEDAIAGGLIPQAQMKLGALGRAWPKRSETDVKRLQEELRKPAAKK